MRRSPRPRRNASVVSNHRVVRINSQQNKENINSTPHPPHEPNGSPFRLFSLGCADQYVAIAGSLAMRVFDGLSPHQDGWLLGRRRGSSRCHIERRRRARRRRDTLERQRRRRGCNPCVHDERRRHPHHEEAGHKVRHGRISQGVS